MTEYWVTHEILTRDTAGISYLLMSVNLADRQT